jgi:hypothetical protein
MIFCGQLQAYAFLITLVVSWKSPTILLTLNRLDAGMECGNCFSNIVFRSVTFWHLSQG